MSCTGQKEDGRTGITYIHSIDKITGTDNQDNRHSKNKIKDNYLKRGVSTQRKQQQQRIVRTIKK